MGGLDHSHGFAAVSRLGAGDQARCEWSLSGSNGNGTVVANLFRRVGMEWEGLHGEPQVIEGDPEGGPRRWSMSRVQRMRRRGHD